MSTKAKKRPSTKWRFKKCFEAIVFAITMYSANLQVVSTTATATANQLQAESTQVPKTSQALGYTQPPNFGFVKKDPDTDSGEEPEESYSAEENDISSSSSSSDETGTDYDVTGRSTDSIKTKQNKRTTPISKSLINSKNYNGTDNSKTKSLAEMYIKRKKEKMDRTYHETEFDIYMVTYATLLKLQPVMDRIKGKISILLGHKCRQEMTWFKSPTSETSISVKPQIQNVDPLGHGESLKINETEDCFSLKNNLDDQLVEFENIILANRKFREDSHAFREQTSEFQKKYASILRNTLGNYSVDVQTDREKQTSKSRTSPQNDLQSDSDPVLQGYLNDAVHTSSKERRTHTQSHTSYQYRHRHTDRNPNRKTEIFKMQNSAKDDSVTQRFQHFQQGQTLSSRLHKIRHHPTADEPQHISQFQNILVNELKIRGLQSNPHIFKIATHIKNSHFAPKVSLILKPNFPPIVQRVIWSDITKIQISSWDNRSVAFKLFASNDGAVKTQKLLIATMILNENSSRFRRRQYSDLDGDQWKFIPIQDGNYFVIFNIKSKSALGINDKSEVILESLKFRDISMLPAPFLWQLSLECDHALADSLREHDRKEKYGLKLALAEVGIVVDGTVINKHGEPVLLPEKSDSSSFVECFREAWLVKITNKRAKNMTLGADSNGIIFVGGDRGEGRRREAFLVY